MRVVGTVSVRTLVRQFLTAHHVVTVLAHSLGVEGLCCVRALSNYFLTAAGLHPLFWLFFNCNITAAFSSRWKFLAAATSLAAWVSLCLKVVMIVVLNHLFVLTLFLVGWGSDAGHVLNAWHILQLVINLSTWMLWEGSLIFLWVWLVQLTSKLLHALLNKRAFAFGRLHKQLVLLHKLSNLALTRAASVARQNVVSLLLEFHVFEACLYKAKRRRALPLSLRWLKHLLAQRFLVDLTREVHWPLMLKLPHNIAFIVVLNASEQFPEV